ncbi:hypothetical protein H310_15064 [Aphanomyces invadans]|uniref:ER membrane protein complex subunit 7 beta-sandwich domain-containing protein n=1 Tax=Aphanomyces invadans TaxID=157072 RepID=A0A024T822_9STRA|nr:hypothetical protein H310_15064 [Aphanomyces invadans]ETV90108.1 hypothetical protein H310_15064 [Aphanomyces invadans]|eukprot:XP_008881264.1 hypothetical protein H310_15064 [Aphanomyces invadans]
MSTSRLAVLGLVWATLVSTITGATIEGRISYPDSVPPPSVDGGLPSLQVVLDGGVRSTLSSQDGRFAFYDVPTGRYTVDIHSPVYIFSQFKVDISAAGDIRVLEFKYPGTPKLAVSHPLVVGAHAKIQYFQPREKFSVMDLVKNPSFLALIVPLVMVWLLPKLTESMLDPEEFKQAQEEMGNAADPSTLIKGFFGGGGDANNDEDSD